MTCHRLHGLSAEEMITNWFWIPFEQAIRSNPNAKPIFHSDRGFQYTSKVFQSKLREQEMVQSMSRVGALYR